MIMREKSTKIANPPRLRRQHHIDAFHATAVPRPGAFRQVDACFGAFRAWRGAQHVILKRYSLTKQ